MTVTCLVQLDERPFDSGSPCWVDATKDEGFLKSELSRNFPAHIS